MLKITSKPPIRGLLNLDHDIAIWAFNRSHADSAKLTIITQRRATISYLHAQGGMGICDTMANYHFAKHGNWRTLEEAIAEAPITADTTILRKITCPSAHGYELMRLLAAENITRAHLMPTYDNIKETLMMKRQIQRSK